MPCRPPWWRRFSAVDRPAASRATPALFVESAQWALPKQVRPRAMRWRSASPPSWRAKKRSLPSACARRDCAASRAARRARSGRSISRSSATAASSRCRWSCARIPPAASATAATAASSLSVLRAAYAGGVPVPRPRWGTSDASVLGSPFFLMDRIEGEALPRRLLRDDAYAAARAGMAPVLGAIAARIHALDLAQPDLAALPRPPRGSLARAHGGRAHGGGDPRSSRSSRTRCSISPSAGCSSARPSRRASRWCTATTASAT